MSKRTLRNLLLFLTILSTLAAAQEPIQVWREFVAKLKAGTLTAFDVQPEYTTVEQQLAWLRQLKEAVDIDKSWPDLEQAVRIVVVENSIRVVARFRMGGEEQTMSFSFLTGGPRWLYSHMEMILLPLDQVGAPPVSQFPDIAEETKAWMREETYWSTIVLNLYGPLSKTMGADGVFDLLKDGPGYFVAAKTWVPFLPSPRAFVLWLCWEQSRLRGNPVTLEKLSDDEAVVAMRPLFFQIYKSASHLKTRISLPEYRRLFETIWTDRAGAAGWSVAFEYADPEGLSLRLRLTRKTEAHP